MAGRLVTEPVRYERHGSCAVIAINRPERRNAINAATAGALADAYGRWLTDDGAKVLVLAGRPEAFCAGADLRELEGLAARIDEPGGPEGFTHRSAPKPTIAAVEGWCVAGGLELAIWCDLRIASQSARLGFTERRFGVPLVDGGTQRLPRIIGLGRAMDLVLTGRIVDAEEARSIGLVNEVVPAGTALERALELGEEIASHPWPTLLADRDSLLAAQGLQLAEGLAFEAQRARDTLGTAQAGAALFRSGQGRHGSSINGTAAGETAATES